MRILIVGAGIAGPTLAYWLARHGMSPTLLESAPALRTGGYLVDFWGAAFDIAERMDLVPELMRRGYVVEEVRLVGDRGERVGGFDAAVFARISGGRFVSLPRSELSAAIYDKLDGRTERIFGDRLSALVDRGGEVEVTLARGGTRTFDLVIGADGLHSSVRALAFEPGAAIEKYLGYEVAASMVTGYQPRDEDVYVLHAEKGRQVARFAMRDDRTLFLFVAATDAPRAADEDPAAHVRRLFAGGRWETPRILDVATASNDFYLDRVSQIRMQRWSRGRVALVGDAAYCVSLLAGQGSALAMIGATVLAGELAAAGGDHERAFERYQSMLGPLLATKQRGAARFASSFAPRTRIGLALRNAATRLLAVPRIAEWTIGRDLRDAIQIPAYEATRGRGAAQNLSSTKSPTGA